MKTIAFIMTLLPGIAGLCVAFNPVQSAVINSFEECAKAGYPVMESYPRQCRTPDGRLFVEPVPPDSVLPEKPSGDSEVVCTMDVKQCPDGTYVGRIPPDCRFAPCPGERHQIERNGSSQEYGPQNPDLIYKCSDNNINDGPVCGRKIEPHPCLIPPCPFTESWSTFSNSTKACEATYVHEYALGACVPLGKKP